MLGLEVVRQTLRGHVGLCYDQLCEMMKVEVLSVNGHAALAPFCSPELQLCDWLPEPWTWQEGEEAYSTQLVRVKGSWRLWAMEEVGLWDCRVWTEGRKEIVKPVGIRDKTLLPWWLPSHPDAAAALDTAAGGLLRDSHALQGQCCQGRW